jgi:hypothetical protein
MPDVMGDVSTFLRAMIPDGSVSVEAKNRAVRQPKNASSPFMKKFKLTRFTTGVGFFHSAYSVFYQVL